MIRKRLKWLLTRHPLLTFPVMLVMATIFGLCSYNIFFYLHGNLQLVRDNGWLAFEVGATGEFVMLFFYGVVSLACYILFKVCEKVMVEWILK